MGTIMFMLSVDEATQRANIMGNCSGLRAIAIIQGVMEGAARAEAERKAEADGGSRIIVPGKAVQGKLFPIN